MQPPPIYRKTENFEKAKKETLDKYHNIYKTLLDTLVADSSPCGFCKEYGCSYCPAHKLCQGRLRKKSSKDLSKVIDKVIKAKENLNSLQDPNK